MKNKFIGFMLFLVFSSLYLALCAQAARVTLSVSPFVRTETLPPYSRLATGVTANTVTISRGETTTTTIASTTTTTVAGATTTTTTSSTTTTTLAPSTISDVKVGNRLYQGKTMIVSSDVLISAVVNYAVSGSLAYVVNGVSTKIDPANITTNGTELTFAQSVPSLSVGETNLKIHAENANGQSTEQSLTLSVLSGPVQVIGPALTYPSPVTLPGTVIIQYTLSTNADIDVYVFDSGGEIVKKFIFQAGQEGGSAGVNNAKWDGVKISGSMLPDGIYSVAIIDHAKGKIITKAKLAVSHSVAN